MGDLERGNRLIEVRLEREGKRGAREEGYGDMAAGAVFAASAHCDLLSISAPERTDVFRHYVYSLIFAHYLIIKE